jgi:hypothetical protein
MTESERTVDDLVSSLCRAGQTLSEHRALLMSGEGWSSVTTSLELKEWSTPDGNLLAFHAYLDGERLSVGRVGWFVDVTRDGDGWLVERSLNVNRNLTELETVAEFPLRTCADSAELARTLVPLVRELLAVPAPEP